MQQALRAKLTQAEARERRAAKEKEALKAKLAALSSSHGGGDRQAPLRPAATTTEAREIEVWEVDDDGGGGGGRGDRTLTGACVEVGRSACPPRLSLSQGQSEVWVIDGNQLWLDPMHLFNIASLCIRMLVADQRTVVKG